MSDNYRVRPLDTVADAFRCTPALLLLPGSLPAPLTLFPLKLSLSRIRLCVLARLSRLCAFVRVLSGFCLYCEPVRVCQHEACGLQIKSTGR